jgi:hypothetical protein
MMAKLKGETNSAITFADLTRAPRRARFMTVVAVLFISALSTVSYLAVKTDGGTTEMDASAAKASNKAAQTEAPGKTIPFDDLTISKETDLASEPKLLAFGYVPSGYCLQTVATPEDSRRQASTNFVVPQKYYRGPAAQRLLVSVSTTNLDPGPDSPAKKTPVDINGTIGQTYTQGTGPITFLFLYFSSGKTAVNIVSTGIDQQELGAFARLLPLSWNENGPAIGTFTLPPGYEPFEPSNPNPNIAGAAITYVRCDNPAGVRRLTFVFNIHDNIENEFWPTPSPSPSPKRASAFPFSRGDIRFEGKRSEDGGGSTVISWAEGNTDFELASQLPKSEITRVLNELKDATALDFKTLADRVDDSTHVFSDGALLPTQGPNILKTIGMLSDGSSIRIRAAISGEKLCLVFSSPSAGAFRGLGCLGASVRPKLEQGNSTDGSTFSVEMVQSRIRALMTLPSGETKEIESFVDPRLPTLRVVVFRRGSTDPLPKLIQFIDETGKAIEEQ